jgi:hypothetical protein
MSSLIPQINFLYNAIDQGLFARFYWLAGQLFIMIDFANIR